MHVITCVIAAIIPLPASFHLWFKALALETPSTFPISLWWTIIPFPFLLKQVTFLIHILLHYYYTLLQWYLGIQPYLLPDVMFVCQFHWIPGNFFPIGNNMNQNNLFPAFQISLYYSLFLEQWLRNCSNAWAWSCCYTLFLFSVHSSWSLCPWLGGEKVCVYENLLFIDNIVTINDNGDYGLTLFFWGTWCSAQSAWCADGGRGGRAYTLQCSVWACGV